MFDMTTSSKVVQNFITDTWVKATWDEFLALAYHPQMQIQNGVLKGELVIQGGEDPFFVWEDAIARSAIS